MTETTTTDDNAEDLTKVREALKNANSEAASYRHKATELESQLTTATANAEKYKAGYLQTKLNAALKDHGATNPKIVKVLDTSKIDLDDAGELVGFDEQLTEAKTEFPELFDAKRSVASIDASDKPQSKKTQSSAERLVARFK
ncbi:phage scaffolding protein [Nocardia sp. NPDC005366]|uniref:phage scaffolding protein n=1 Tax=Nocardia sp. NPDC005366 TaxID=3156878 RepID=UPI0033B5E974